MITPCPHCQTEIEIDATTLAALAGQSHFACPACRGAVPVPAGAKPRPNLPGTSRKVAAARAAQARSGHRNLLILGAVALLVLGGLGHFLASQKSGDTNTTTQNIRNEIINNSYFTQLIADGVTTKEDLEAIGDIRSYRDGFIGISTASLGWTEANALASSTGASVLEATEDNEVLSWLNETFALPKDVAAWILTQGDVGLLTGAGAVALKNADGNYKVLLQWKPSEQKTIDRSPPLVTSIGLSLIKVPGTDYYLAATEVTQEQWQTVMGYNPSQFKGENLPVENLNWYSAMDFCRRMTERERVAGRLPDGYVYTLPTRQQWMLACHAGNRAKHADPLDEVAWYQDNSGGITQPVGTKRANAWGFHDMHGNVSEWCLDETTTSDQGQKATCGSKWSSDSRTSLICGGIYFQADNTYGLGLRPAAVPGSDNVFPASTGSSLGKSSNFRNGFGMEMIWVKPNHVQGVEHPWNDDSFTTTLRVLDGYYLAATEVTQAQWQAVMENNPSNFRGRDLPVENVDWKKAMEFCSKLTDVERVAGNLPKGYIYTLPSGVQWEYARRAGATEPIADPPDQVAWYRENSGGSTHPVATKKPNAWGFHDMHGNVREWCLTTPSSLKDYTVRGGDWFSEKEDFNRSSSFSPSYGKHTMGFRPALASVSSNSYPRTATDEPSDKGPKYRNSVGLAMIWVKPDSKRNPFRSAYTEETENNSAMRNSKGFYLGETEVTQEQWQAVMGNNPSQFKGKNLPVEQVSRKQALDFCKRLTELERGKGVMPKGFVYTLPYREQLRHVCQEGGDGVDAGLLDPMAWHRENSDNRTHPVATKRPNAIGFYDMHGNVAEWCLNDRGRSGLQTSILSTSGGSWRDAPNHLLSGGQVSDQGFSHIGFRIIAVRSNVLDREKQKEGTSDE